MEHRLTIRLPQIESFCPLSPVACGSRRAGERCSSTMMANANKETSLNPAFSPPPPTQLCAVPYTTLFPGLPLSWLRNAKFAVFVSSSFSIVHGVGGRKFGLTGARAARNSIEEGEEIDRARSHCHVSLEFMSSVDVRVDLKLCVSLHGEGLCWVLTRIVPDFTANRTRILFRGCLAVAAENGVKRCDKPPSSFLLIRNPRAMETEPS
ncbi:uncharacterized protein IWZ02DRAFT_116250 [Phyllosticta citriasiana]|uniref:uncharacterized protein n=1 Tax=Phyllosticta citriasiana TaxID=595635 RepID=UPI0030FD5483